MGLKILYNYLKHHNGLHIYKDDTKWQDYLPSDIEIVMSVHKNDNEDFEIYYSKKCNEFYRISIWNLYKKYKCYIEILDENEVKNLIFDGKLYNYLLNNWKEKFDLLERI